MLNAVTAVDSAEYDLFIGSLGGAPLVAIVVMHREGGAMLAIPLRANFEELPDEASRIPAEARGVKWGDRLAPTTSILQVQLIDVDDAELARFKCQM